MTTSKKPTPNQLLQAKVDRLQERLDSQSEALQNIALVLWPFIKDQVDELVDDRISSMDVQVW